MLALAEGQVTWSALSCWTLAAVARSRKRCGRRIRAGASRATTPPTALTGCARALKYAIRAHEREAMPPSDKTAKDAWVTRVLGIAVLGEAKSGQSTVPTPEPRALNAIFVRTKDAVDKQMSALQAAFRDVEDATAVEIADRGLPAVSRSLFTPLQGALRDYGGAAPARRADAAHSLEAALAGLENFIATDKVLPHLERNPFGIAFTAGSALTNAVREMRALLASMPNV